MQAIVLRRGGPAVARATLVDDPPAHTAPAHPRGAAGAGVPEIV